MDHLKYNETSHIYVVPHEKVLAKFNLGEKNDNRLYFLLFSANYEHEFKRRWTVHFTVVTCKSLILFQICKTNFVHTAKLAFCQVWCEQYIGQKGINL